MKSKKKYYLIYTLLFVVCCLLCFYPYWSSKKTFIYDGDGWSQHYKAYLYYGEYLRGIIKNFFVNHEFVIPQWDFSVGEGAGILETFHYYVIGDTIAFLNVFVPTDYTWIFYNFSIILRLYLSGIFFSWLCFYKKKENDVAVLGGTFAYVFSFWALFNAVRHIYFLNPMLYFPLVILGIEKIINKESPVLFTLSVCISCMSNFYYFYNIVFLTVLYVVVRFLIHYFKKWKEMLQTILSLFKYSILGVLLGGMILVPILFVFLNDPRMGISFDKHLLYPISYYLNLPSSFISTTREYWLCMGYATPVIFALVCTFLKWKEKKTLVALDCLFVLMILFPIFGQIMNGNSYISNKWCFAGSLLVAYNLVENWDDIKNHKLVLGIIYLFVCIVCVIFGSGINVNFPLILGALFFVVLCFMKESKIQKSVLISLIIVNVSFTAYWRYAPNATNYIGTATTIEEDKDVYVSNEAYALRNHLKDDEFYRYSGSHLEQNAATILHTHSTDYYWSLANPYVSQYREDLESNEYLLQKYYEYDKRATLYSLASVKYYITDKDYQGILPYGFREKDSFEDYRLYENEYMIPFGYTYEKTYSYDSWIKLSAMEKEEILTQAIVLDHAKDDKVSLLTKTLNYQIQTNGDIEIFENKIKVKDEKGTVTFIFDDVLNQELYMNLKGLSYDDGKNWLKNKTTEVTISYETSSSYEDELDLSTADNRYYNGRENFVLNLGNHTSSVTLKFSDKGTYSFDEIFLTINSMENYEKFMNERKEDILEDVKFSTNRVEGIISASKDEYLCLSIPYSKGWTAYLDGNEVEIHNANVAYSAIKIDKGQHEVVLKYETPYLKLGCGVSCLGILLCGVDLLVRRKRK